jgi:hypothetical protein
MASEKLNEILAQTLHGDSLSKQHKQLTYNVTLGRVHETIVEEKEVLHISCVCVCAYVWVWVHRRVYPYLASMQRACTISSPASLAPNFFAHYLMNGTIFGEKLLNLNVCFDFLYNLYLNISQYKKN